MKRHLSEAHVAKIMEHLLERFGEPIGNAQGDRQGPPSTGGKKKDMGNRGFGAKLDEAGSPAMCDQCGGMMGMEEGESMCTQCGQMSPHMGPAPAAPVAVAAEPAVDAVVVVKGAGGGGTGGGGKIAQGLKVKDMGGIPTTGSGRGTQAPSGGAPAPRAPAPAPGPREPTPMPATLDQYAGSDDSKGGEARQEELGFDLDHDGEEGESPQHRQKVLGHMDQGDDEMDEDSMPSSGGSSSPPPSGGSSPPPPSGGSSPPPSSSPPSGMDQEEMQEDMDLDEVTPPGREKQVRALKKKGDVDNPWAVAWASYNKSHKKK